MTTRSGEPSSNASESLCSIITAERSCDPIGHALDIPRGLLIETPKPWSAEVHKSPNLPPGVSDLLTGYYRSRLEAYYEGGVELMAERGYNQAFVLIAPDKEYSVQGCTRLIEYEKPELPFSNYKRREWLVPTTMASLLVEAAITGQVVPEELSQYEVSGDDQRDIIVCTQGNIDTCCAKFGFPVYRSLRCAVDEADHAVRVWQATHFQYHRYAPVALDLPDGVNWGRITSETASALVNREGPIERVRNLYMGWSGAGENPFAQVAEREAMLREGWDWLLYERQIASIVESDDGNAAEVEIAFNSTDNTRSGRYCVTVQVTGSVELPQGCFHPDLSSEVKKYEVVDSQLDVTSVSRGADVQPDVSRQWL